MTNDELRREIAKTKGWQDFHQLNFTGRIVGKRNGIPEIVPDWPIDISAAWGLVIEAERQNVGFDLASILVEPKTDPRIEYEATFYDPWGGPMAKKYTANEPSAPLAICNAWLKWKQSA